MISRLVNSVLAPLGVQVKRCGSAASKRPWDGEFLRWIADAERQNRDVNDVADERWGDVRHLIAKYYLPHIKPDTTVLELGPGTGRITRHTVGKCGKLIIVDFSETVIGWITRYLINLGRRNFTTFLVADCRLQPIPDSTVDLAMADGVVHHLDPEDLHRYLTAFHRVLVPGGLAVFNFVNLMAPEGYAKFRSFADSSNMRDGFRWYHPEIVRFLCERAGFANVNIQEERVLTGDFVCYVTCRRQ